MANDGTVKIGTEIDESGFKSGLSKLGGVAKTGLVGITAATGAASAAIGAVTKSSLDAYASYEQLIGGVETLFKDSADTVKEYASNAYKTAGVSANAYMEQATAFSASLIQSLGGDTQAAAEYANQAIMDMSDNANKMGTDIGSIQQTYQSLMRGNYAMLDNLKLGYGGTKKELERLVADAEQLTGQALDPTKFSDIITAIHAVQTEMGITGTTAKESSSTIEGSVASMKAAWSNLVTGIADENADLDMLIDNFVLSFETAAGNLIPRLEKILSGIGKLVVGLAPIVAEELPKMMEALLPPLIEATGQLLLGLAASFPEFVDIGISGFQSLIDGLLENLPSLLDIGAQVITALASGIVEAASYLLEVGGQLLQNLIDGISQGLPDIISSAPQVVQSFIDGINNDFPSVLESGTNMIKEFITGLTSSIKELAIAAPQVIETFLDSISTNFPLVLESGAEILKTLAEGLIESAPYVLEAMPKILNTIVEFIVENLPKIVDLGVDIILSLIDGLIETIPVLAECLPEVIKSIVDVIVENLPKIVDAGIDIIFSLIDGILEAIPDLVAALPQIITAIGEGIIALLGGIVDIGKAIVQSLWDGIVDGVKSLFGGGSSGSGSGGRSAGARNVGPVTYSNLSAEAEGEGASTTAGLLSNVESANFRAAQLRALESAIPAAQERVFMATANMAPASTYVVRNQGNGQSGAAPSPVSGSPQKVDVGISFYPREAAMFLKPYIDSEGERQGPNLAK